MKRKHIMLTGRAIVGALFLSSQVVTVAGSAGLDDVNPVLDTRASPRRVWTATALESGEACTIRVPW